MTDICKEMDKLILMIQKCSTLHSGSLSNYKDQVTLYRQRLYRQSMKIRKMIEVLTDETHKM